jgi:hypothetical protein
MSYTNFMFDFFSDFDISMDIYGKEDSSLNKQARKVKTLIDKQNPYHSKYPPQCQCGKLLFLKMEESAGNM